MSLKVKHLEDHTFYGDDSPLVDWDDLRNGHVLVHWHPNGVGSYVILMYSCLYGGGIYKHGRLLATLVSSLAEEHSDNAYKFWAALRTALENKGN